MKKTVVLSKVIYRVLFSTAYDTLFAVIKKGFRATAIAFLFWLVLGYAASLQAQLSVDPTNREASRQFYLLQYLATENVPIEWTGNVDNGQAGTTSAAFKNAVYTRVNYFRAMAGVPAAIIDNPSSSDGAQKAALMMSANNDIRHDPPSTWRFYTSAGATAAAKSNLYIGINGTQAIDGYLQDPGVGNEAAGHRRWILYPQTRRMGTGDLPASPGYDAANVLWVIEDATRLGPRPAVRDEFVAWPPKGYVPYQLVWPRWSFSYPGADFSGANVSLQRNGAAVPVRMEPVQTGEGENTLVFILDNLDPNNWSNPAMPNGDETTTVSVSGVKIAGKVRSFSYNVTKIDVNNLTGVPSYGQIRLPTMLNFGRVRTKKRLVRLLTISNDGPGPLTVSRIQYPRGFSGTWSGTIPAGGTQTVRVVFYPTSKRLYKGTATVYSDAAAGVNTFYITGRGR
jgi:uncharacterized protein YkwD